MPKSVGARTQPCLTPMRISNGSEELPLNGTVPFVSVWKHSIMLCSLGGQPIFGRTLKRPSLLTRSNYRRSAIDMIFSLRQLQEKCREQHMPLYIAFIDLTKAFEP